MAELRPKPGQPPALKLPVNLRGQTPATNEDKMLCERCGAEMYRMHAVWRCSACGFKTDCCGW
jgi:ribosomal protein L37AE/L43A